jgi:hypothetical protein
MPDPFMHGLGSCCICKTYRGVRNVVMLDFKTVVPGTGWGCLVCNLPPDGASAVLCDPCMRRYMEKEDKLKYICVGYPAQDDRARIDDIKREPHMHDLRKHQDENIMP